MNPISDPVLNYLGLPWGWDLGYDLEEGCWVATIAELPDFFAAGETAGEAAANAREALASHIAGYLATGTRIPTPSPRSAPIADLTVGAQAVTVAA
jgi:predicted RNase H-like HicB family nuclease